MTEKDIVSAILNELINEFNLPSTFSFDEEVYQMALEEIKKKNEKKAKYLMVIALYKEYGRSLLK